MSGEPSSHLSFVPFARRRTVRHNPRQFSESCLQYFFSTDGQNQQGPIERDGLIAAGVTRDSMVWREGMGGWIRAGDLAELADLFQSPGSIVAEPTVAEPVIATPQPSYPPQYPQAGYRPEYATPHYVPATSGFAIASLVLGILGLCCCNTFIFSLLAVIFGHLAKAEIRRGQKTGSGLATAGLVMGYIGLILGALVIGIALIQGTFHSTTYTYPSSSPVPVPRTIPKH